MSKPGLKAIPLSSSKVQNEANRKQINLQDGLICLNLYIYTKEGAVIYGSENRSFDIKTSSKANFCFSVALQNLQKDSLASLEQPKDEVR